MNKFVKIIGANALLFGGMLLASCGGKASVNVEKVTDFTFNGQTGEFSFKGVKEAKHYYVRVYNQHEYKTVDEKQVELAIEDKVPVAARRVRHKADQVDYSGEVALDNLQGGHDYDVCVFTYVKDADGEFQTAYTDPTAFICVGTYKTPELEYSGKKLLAGENKDGKLQITIRSNFFGFDSNYDQGAPDYEFKIYDSTDAVKETKVLHYADVQTEAVEGTSKSGEKTITYNHKGVVTFDKEYDFLTSKISVQVLSTDSTHWVSSGVSNKGVLQDVLGDPNAEETGGNNSDTKGGGGTKSEEGGNQGDPGQQSGEPAQQSGEPAGSEGSKAEGSGDGSKAEGSGEGPGA